MRSRQMWLMIGGLAGTLGLGTFAVAADEAPTTQPTTQPNTQGEQATTPPRKQPNTIPSAQTTPRTDRQTTPTEDPQRSGIAVPGNAAKQAASAVGTGQMGDPTWVATKLHRVNQGEIKLAKIEREQGESAKAKSFAAQIVRDHQRADRQLMAYAKQKKIDLDAVPTTSGESDSGNRDRAVASGEDADDVQMQVKMNELQKLKGAELDRQFASTMLDGHAKVMDLVRDARAATKDRQLQALLGGLLPTLENHHRIAAMLNNTLGGTSSVEPTHQR